MRTRNTRRGSLLAAAALVLGLFTAPAALAVEPEPNPALIDPTASTSLTITKCEQTETNGTTPGDGTAASAPDTCTPIADVKYTATLLDYDLTTQQGWHDLAALGGDITAAVKTATVVDGTTAADGTVVFNGLTIGAYLVSETGTPDNVTPAEDFIVTLPMTNPANNSEWNYDVFVYPKNSITSIDKTVSDSTAVVAGDTITFTVTADIPRIDVAGGATLKKYEIVDAIDSKLEITDAQVAVSMIGANAAVLAKDTDYTVTIAADQTVTISFTDAGRVVIADARAWGDATTQIQVVFTPTVKEAGVIANEALLFPNEFTVDGVPSPEVLSKWGELVVTKTGTDQKEAAAYQGAKFDVHTCTVPAGTVAGAPVNGATLGAKIAEGETDATATMTVTALRANDWKDGVAHTPTNDDWYCLVETKAPTGYELQATPIAFQVLSVTDTTATVEITVVDVPSNGGFRLPLTGAAGVLVLSIAGVLLVGGAIVLAVANKKRRKVN